MSFAYGRPPPALVLSSFSLSGDSLSLISTGNTERFIFIWLCFRNGSDWLVSGAVTCC